MDRQDLEKKDKAALLALATEKGLQVTPAMTKNVLMDVIVAADQMAAAGTPAPTEAPAPAVNIMDATNSRIAELEAQLAQANTLLATQSTNSAAPVVADVATAAKLAEDERRNPLPQEGQLRTLDGKLVPIKRVRVTIMATENEQEDVKLGLNGHLLQIKRGVPVEIPHHYLDVLKNSTIDTFTKDPETGKVQRVQIQRYPYTVELV
jgi:hypothetical protein